MSQAIVMSLLRMPRLLVTHLVLCIMSRVVLQPSSDIIPALNLRQALCTRSTLELPGPS